MWRSRTHRSPRAWRRVEVAPGWPRLIDTLIIIAFGIIAVGAAASMLVLRQPMRVALALITTMTMLGGIYGLLGVHFLAAF